MFEKKYYFDVILTRCLFFLLFLLFLLKGCTPDQRFKKIQIKFHMIQELMLNLFLMVQYQETGECVFMKSFSFGCLDHQKYLYSQSYIYMKLFFMDTFLYFFFFFFFKQNKNIEFEQNIGFVKNFNKHYK